MVLLLVFRSLSPVNLRKFKIKNMALENLISVSFSEEELTQLDQHLLGIRQLLQGKTVNLTPEWIFYGC